MHYLHSFPEREREAGSPVSRFPPAQAPRGPPADRWLRVAGVGDSWSDCAGGESENWLPGLPRDGEGAPGQDFAAEIPQRAALLQSLPVSATVVQ